MKLEFTENIQALVNNFWAGLGCLLTGSGMRSLFAKLINPRNMKIWRKSDDDHDIIADKVATGLILTIHSTELLFLFWQCKLSAKSTGKYELITVDCNHEQVVPVNMLLAQEKWLFFTPVK